MCPTVTASPSVPSRTSQRTQPGPFRQDGNVTDRTQPTHPRQPQHKSHLSLQPSSQPWFSHVPPSVNINTEHLGRFPQEFIGCFAPAEDHSTEEAVQMRSSGHQSVPIVEDIQHTGERTCDANTEVIEHSNAQQAGHDDGGTCAIDTNNMSHATTNPVVDAYASNIPVQVPYIHDENNSAGVIICLLYEV